MKNKILALRYLCRSRLPDIKRWNKVDVVTTTDKKIIKNNSYLQNYVENKESLYVCWYNSKCKTNTHPFEIREIPLSNIDDLIERTAIRLKNKSKPYN